MSRIKIEVFLSEHDSNDEIDLVNLLREIEREYKGRVEIVIKRGCNQVSAEANMDTTPALIVDDLIRFTGICPDRESLPSAS